MAKVKIGIIISTTRAARFGRQTCQMDQGHRIAARRPDRGSPGSTRLSDALFRRSGVERTGSVVKRGCTALAKESRGVRRCLCICDGRIQSRRSGGAGRTPSTTPIRNGTRSRRPLSAMARSEQPAQSSSCGSVAIELQMAPTRTGCPYSGADFAGRLGGRQRDHGAFVSPTECHRHVHQPAPGGPIHSRLRAERTTNLVRLPLERTAKERHDVHQAHQADRTVHPDHGRRRREAAPRLRVRRRPASSIRSCCSTISATTGPDDYRAGFPWHPHRGIETITYVLAGTVEHGDSLGNRGKLGAGRRAVDDRRQRHPASGNAAGRRRRAACTASSSGPTCPPRSR